MNRAERRRGKLDKLNPRLPYAEFLADAGEDAVKVMMVLLRQLTGPDAPFSDEELWDSTRELINRGLLDVYFRFHRNGDIEIHPEFLIPHENDNEPTPGGFAA